jgi:hypothetical protein
MEQARSEMQKIESVNEMVEMVKSANANGQMDIVQMIEKHIAIARPAEFNKAVIQQVEKEIGIWEYDEMDWE